ncbi:hypothetical protein [Nocardia brasiliensis]|uniref:hypothetical protein n=1 Tax=Nocardia brasiliensis TaxID=37326 RepID=UPI003D8FBC15
MTISLKIQQAIDQLTTFGAHVDVMKTQADTVHGVRRELLSGFHGDGASGYDEVTGRLEIRTNEYLASLDGLKGAAVVAVNMLLETDVKNRGRFLG